MHSRAYTHVSNQLKNSQELALDRYPKQSNLNFSVPLDKNPLLHKFLGFFGAKHVCLAIHHFALQSISEQWSDHT